MWSLVPTRRGIHGSASPSTEDRPREDRSTRGGPREGLRQRLPFCEAGRTVYVAGQIGWDRAIPFHSDDFVEQWDQALANVVAVVPAAGGGPGTS